MRVFVFYKSENQVWKGCWPQHSSGSESSPQGSQISGLSLLPHPSSSSSSLRGLLGPLATDPALADRCHPYIAWPIGSGPPMLAVFCSGPWNAWCVDYGAVHSPRSSGCWWLYSPPVLTAAPNPLPLCTLRSLGFSLWSGCCLLLCLFRPFLPENPCLMAVC